MRIFLRRGFGVGVEILTVALVAIAISSLSAKEEKAYTPGKGSRERKAILDTFREETKQWSKLDVVFVVHHLKVHNGWAYVKASPQSRDGRDHYEPLDGVLKKEKEKWTMARGSDCDPQCPGGGHDCADGEKVCRNSLHVRFPEAPADIFPSENSH